MQGNPVRPVTATIRLCFPRNKTANIVVMKGEFLKKKKKKNTGILLSVLWIDHQGITENHIYDLHHILTQARWAKDASL